MSCSATGKNNCKCSYTPDCSRKGNCCQCVAYHRDKNEATACFFTADGELSYDRSLKNLMLDRGITLH